jgi:hypothetical protein
MNEMHIFDYDLHDYDFDFQPDDIYDFEFWMTVNVGDGIAGNLYQVRICSPISIKRIQNKKGCFMVDQWEGLPRLVSQMNEFISEVTDKPSPDDPYVLLSRHWLWEYERM